MRFGIDLNVIEVMTAAGAGMALSYYLRQQDESMNTDDVVRVLAGVGSYVIGKGLYILAKEIREHSELNQVELPEMTQQPPSHRYR